MRVAESTDPLLAEVDNFIARFVVLSADQRLVVSLWVLHTWALDAAFQTPYLCVSSPEMRCGKSRLLETVELLVARPWSVVLPSEAVLYRRVHAIQPTLLLDETDTIFAPGRKGDRFESIRALLNSGHRAGASVPRCVGKDAQVMDFNVFCAKLLAGIGALPPTVADRGVPIRLQRKTPQEHVEPFIRRDEEKGAEELSGRLKEWAEEHLDALKEVRPDMPDALDDRAREGTEALVAIADAMGCGKEARHALVVLCTGERADNIESQRMRLLRDLRDIFSGTARKHSTRYLLSKLHAIEEAPWSRYYGRGLESKDLAALLRPYGVQPTTLRFKKKPNAKGYKRSDLESAWERYLPKLEDAP